MSRQMLCGVQVHRMYSRLSPHDDALSILRHATRPHANRTEKD